jgi:hypothetical protein
VSFVLTEYATACINDRVQEQSNTFSYLTVKAKQKGKAVLALCKLSTRVKKYGGVEV